VDLTPTQGAMLPNLLVYNNGNLVKYSDGSCLFPTIAGLRPIIAAKFSA
jgi:hypothetical protein